MLDKRVALVCQHQLSFLYAGVCVDWQHHGCVDRTASQRQQYIIRVDQRYGAEFRHQPRFVKCIFYKVIAAHASNQ